MLGFIHQRPWPRAFVALVLSFLFILLAACSSRGGATVQPPASNAQGEAPLASAATAAPSNTVTILDDTTHATVEAAVADIIATSEAQPAQATAAKDDVARNQARGGGVLPAGPSAAIAPATGSANTQVTVSGSGFPANVRVDLYLAGLVRSSSGRAAPQSYANTITDGAGNYRMTLVMPAQWPSGEAIVSGQLTFLVATQDFAARASATFAYQAPIPTPPGPTPTWTPLPTTPTWTPLPPTPTWTPLPATATPTPARNPFVEADPHAGYGNTQITLRGGGFPANTAIYVSLGTFDAQVGGGGEPMRYGAAVTDGGGYFTLTFTMPTVWPDGTAVEPGLLLILVATPDFAQQASDVFEYQTPTPTPANNPSAEIEPRSGTANTQVTVRGGGFPANTQLNLYLSGLVNTNLGRQAPNSYASTTTDGAGNYRLNFTMPANWPDGGAIRSGKLALLVATADFKLRASVTFDYVAPTPTAVSESGWQGRYYNNPNLSGEPVLRRNDAELHFTWGSGSPDPLVPNDEFSASWTRSTTFNAALYRFTVEVDDGVRLFVDDRLILESWREGARRTMSIDYPMQAGSHTVRLDFYEAHGEALVTLDWDQLDGGWRASYFDNKDLRGAPVLERYEPTLQFDWGAGSPDPRIPVDGFSARWTRRISLPGGVYRVTATTDDGMRIWVKDRLILDQWQTQAETYVVDIYVGGGDYDVRVEYFENTANAQAQVRWEKLELPVPAPTATPGSPRAGVLFDGDPRTNRRGANPTFCSGFESECNFAGCAPDYRLVWGPYCRESDYPYIKPGLYQVTLQGTGAVRAGATDYGATNQLFAFGQHEFTLPGSYRFCWAGRQNNGYGFETVVQSLDPSAAVQRITVEYIGEQCP
ncbi:MAG: PA14 domain-containing protein [Caldilineaceae bacterium]